MNTGSLATLTEDLSIELGGTTLCYCVDPAEAMTFCFPALEGVYDVSAFADEQAALYEAFYGSERPRLLMVEYGPEMEAILNSVNRKVKAAYASSRFFELLKASDPTDARDDTDVAQAQLLLRASKTFNITLAVVMGIYRQGADRFVDIYTALTRNDSYHKYRTIIRDVSQTYKASPFVDELFEKTVRFLGQRWTPDQLERRRHSIYADASAIERLLFINNELLRMSLPATNPDVLLLYVSSAERSRFIFGLDEVKSRLPLINGRPFSPHRRPSDLLAYVIYKRPGRTREERLRNTLGHVEEHAKRQRVIASIRVNSVTAPASASICPLCILEGGAEENAQQCHWRTICDQVREMDAAIEAHKKSFRNLGLVATVLEYSKLRDAAPTTKADERYVKYFASIYDRIRTEGTLSTAALERMDQLEKLITIKRRFKEFLSPGLTRRHSGLFLREGRDVITSREQFLPTQPHIQSERYGHIVAKIIAYFKTPVHVGYRNTRVLSDAYDDYLDLDVHVDVLTLEHELVRCYLYLGFPTIDGDQHAFEHARDMLGVFHNDGTRELLYVVLWAARRLKLFEVAEQYGRDAVKAYPEDARFWHGLGLNALAWLYSSTQADLQWRSDRIEAGGDAIRRACALYADNAGAELLGVMHKDLALLYTLDERAARTYNVKAARAEMEQLKELISPSIWQPDHPEYMHAEAQVLLCEFKASGRKDRNRLKAAASLIEHAIDIYDKPWFGELKRAIEGEIVELKVWEVTITDVPHCGEGGADEELEGIAGTAFGSMDWAPYKIAIYALTNEWWVQPFATEPLTGIVRGHWENKTHLGRQYAALLVKATFSPPARTSRIPLVDNMNVFAVTMKQAKKATVEGKA